MKIEIPRVVRALELGGYVAEMKEARILMWVNPPVSKRRAFYETADRIDQLNEAIALLGPKGPAPEPPRPDMRPNAYVGLPRDELSAKVEELYKIVCAWWAEMWSQGEAADTHWTAEEVDKLFSDAGETDPELIDFIRKGCLRLMAEYRESAKKN